MLCCKELVYFRFPFSFRAVGSMLDNSSLCCLIAVRGRGWLCTYYGLHHVVGNVLRFLSFHQCTGCGWSLDVLRVYHVVSYGDDLFQFQLVSTDCVSGPCQL